jgi:hypothetical protein
MNYYVINKSGATVHLFGGKLSLAPKGSGGDAKRLLGFSRDHDNIQRLEAKNLIEVVDEVEYRKRAGGKKPPAAPPKPVDPPAPPPAPPEDPPVAPAADPDEVDTVELDEDGDDADDSGNADVDDEGDVAPAMSMTEFKGLKKKEQVAKLDELGVEDYDDSTKGKLESAYEAYLNA